MKLIFIHTLSWYDLWNVCRYQVWSLRSFYTRRVLSHRRTLHRRWRRCTSCAQSSCLNKIIMTLVCVLLSRCSSWLGHSNDRTPTRMKTWYFCVHSGTPISQSSSRTIPSCSRCVDFLSLSTYVFIITICACVIKFYSYLKYNLMEINKTMLMMMSLTLFHLL